MGRITVSKVEHFQKEFLPFFNSQKRKTKVRVELTEAEKLKGGIRQWKPEGSDVRVELNEEKIVKAWKDSGYLDDLKSPEDLLIKSNLL